jgi:hypothetical protein
MGIDPVTRVATGAEPDSRDGAGDRRRPANDTELARIRTNGQKDRP